jgi:hypothetical protein
MAPRSSFSPSGEAFGPEEQPSPEEQPEEHEHLSGEQLMLLLLHLLLPPEPRERPAAPEERPEMQPEESPDEQQLEVLEEPPEVWEELVELVDVHL